MSDADGLFAMVGAACALMFGILFVIGKFTFWIIKGIIICIQTAREEQAQEAHTNELTTRIEQFNHPHVSPWLEPCKTEFKFLGTIDARGISITGNAIVLRALPTSIGGPRTVHIEPISTHSAHSSLDQRIHRAQEMPSYLLRVFLPDERVASCYVAGSILIVENENANRGDTPLNIYCADTVHALLVYLLWPSTRIEYHIGNDYLINIPKRCLLSSPPTPLELETHGLRLTSKADPDFKRPPILQSCWDCVYYYWTPPNRGVHPTSGIRWCIHGAYDMLPDPLFENRRNAIITTPFFVRFTIEKHSVDKERKTYQLFAQFGRTISTPSDSPELQKRTSLSTFTTTFNTVPVPSDSIQFMPRGSNSMVPETVRWETIMSGERCPHSLSPPPPNPNPNPTPNLNQNPNPNPNSIPDETAPPGSAFLPSLNDLPTIESQGLIPIAGLAAMDSIQRSAMSLSVADRGRWVYWKNPYQCLGCAVAIVGRRMKPGSTVVFT